MIDINLLAEDFDAELDKVRDWNNEKRQERGEVVNAERLRSFLQELTALSDKYEIYIEGAAILNDVQAGKKYDNLTCGKYDRRYKVDERMIIDTDSDRGVMYNAHEMQVRFLDRTWTVIGSAKEIPKPNKKFEMIARAGLYHFYANIDPNDHDDRGYCIIGWRDM